MDIIYVLRTPSRGENALARALTGRLTGELLT